mmetsp:Transcript_69621/g.196355  ORF Transcript_69621/g.196355 Transcript_69621/m.196355 type:complete len:166 (+) Transcript_69621:2062-2559(+)
MSGRGSCLKGRLPLSHFWFQIKCATNHMCKKVVSHPDEIAAYEQLLHSDCGARKFETEFGAVCPPLIRPSPDGSSFQEAISDLHCWSSGPFHSELWIDVTTANPCPAEGVARAAGGDAAAACRSEQDKVRRYGSGCDSAVMLPFALEHFGRAGPGAVFVLDQLCE